MQIVCHYKNHLDCSDSITFRLPYLATRLSHIEFNLRPGSFDLYLSLTLFFFLIHYINACWRLVGLKVLNCVSGPLIAIVGGLKDTCHSENSEAIRAKLGAIGSVGAIDFFARVTVQTARNSCTAWETLSLSIRLD